MIQMTEKHQYGQKLSLHVTEVIKTLRTDKSNIHYLETLNHGNVLLMDDEIQLSTQDEYRYHEMLVHPAMKSNHATNPRVLILGGGDGCAAREVYKWANVQDVTIVDYDEQFVTEFGKGYLAALNKHVYARDTLIYVCSDVIEYLNTTPPVYDVILIDLPDPDSQEMVDLYSNTIRLSKNVLKPNGVLGMHVGPALLNPNHKHWETIASFRDLLLHTFHGKDVKFNTCYVPSFSNEWAFLHMDHRIPIYQSNPINVIQLCRYWNPTRDSTIPLDINEIYRRRL